MDIVKVFLRHNGFDWLVRIYHLISTHLPYHDIYEVLHHQVSLDLRNYKTRKAIYNKQQRVRFLQNHVIAFYDTAFGDGDLFADYRCSPGYAVDQFQKGQRIYTLISLRETKMRGDQENLFIERTIRNGFSGTKEYLQIDIDHVTHNLDITIQFPTERCPSSITLHQSNQPQPIAVNNLLEQLPDGHFQFHWEKEHPRQGIHYLVTWVW